MEKDFTHHNADISVTYAHRSLEELFGSFGFLQALAEGKSVDDILGSDCENQIFMVNPLVMRFCLWLQTKKVFNCLRNSYQRLVLFAAKRIDFYLLNTKAVEEVYPAMNINATLVDKDSLRLKFFKDVLEMCQFARVLHIDVIDYDSTLYDKVYGVLGLMGCNLLHKLTHFSNRKLCQIPLVHRNVTSISIVDTDTETFQKYLTILLPKYNLLKRNPQVYAEVDCRVDCELSTLITQPIKQLHLLGSYSHCRVTLLMAGKLSNCPQLTHLILK